MSRQPAARGLPAAGVATFIHEKRERRRVCGNAGGLGLH
jgi:hypothetical protein